MSEEVEPRQTWQQRQDLATQKIREAMNGATPEVFLEAANNAAVENAEWREMVEWWTDVFDQACVELHATFGSSLALQSAARRQVAEAFPEKWTRFRELEGVREAKGLAHQHLASGAHASIIESSLRSSSFYGD